MGCCGDKIKQVTTNVRDVVNTVRKGTVGLTKVALRIDIADKKDIDSRRDICRECEFSTKNEKFLNHSCKGLTSRSKCTKCKCVIAAKTSIKKEKCPLDLWKQITN